MIRTKAFLGAAVLCVCLLPLAKADMSVTLPQVDVVDIPLNTPTTITVSAVVGADPALVLSGIQLIRYNPVTNKPMTVLCQMYDDGTHGDALPGDTRFTGQATLNIATPGPICLRVSALYRRVVTRFLSPVIELDAFVPLTDADLQAAYDMLMWAQTEFDTLTGTIGREAAAQQVFDELRGQPGVASATLGGGWITFTMTSGVTQGLMVEDSDETDGCCAAPVHGMLVPLLWATFDPSTITKIPGNTNLLIWMPGYSNGQNAIGDHAVTQFGGAAWASFSPSPPVMTKDAAADLNSVKGFGGYGTIIMHTHGGYDSSESSGNRIFLVSGTPNTPANYSINSTDIAAHRVVPAVHGMAFTAKFVSKYVSTMPDSFLYLGACHSIQEDGMWNAFKAKGARVAFGWSEEVDRGFNASTFKLLIDAMVPTSLSTDPKSAQAAFDGIATKTDPYGGHSAVFRMRYNGTGWNQMYLITPDIINGGFETGDFKGWTHGGDYSYATVVAHPHNGSYSGALGRWDQSYHGWDPSAEPAGSEWLYQDVLVPSNATKLSFWYDIETYDTAAWDWVDMQIRTPQGGVLAAVLSQAGKPGYDYGPYWHLGWTNVQTDVSGYRGQKIRIYFDQRLDGWGDQQRCYFDEVKFVKQ